MIDQWLERCHARAPVATAILAGTVGFGGFVVLIALAIASTQNYQQREAEWWAKFRVEHDCRVQSVLPGSAGFLDHEHPKVAWDCDGEIYLREPR